MLPRVVPATTARDGLCLDGSLPSYSVRRNASSAAYVLFLEGGGWCNGPTANAGSAAADTASSPLSPTTTRACGATALGAKANCAAERSERSIRTLEKSEVA